MDHALETDVSRSPLQNPSDNSSDDVRTPKRKTVSVKKGFNTKNPKVRGETSHESRNILEEKHNTKDEDFMWVSLLNDKLSFMSNPDKLRFKMLVDFVAYKTVQGEMDFDNVKV